MYEIASMRQNFNIEKKNNERSNFLKFHGFCYRQYLLYYGNDPTSSPTVLPMGSYELDFLNQVKLYIFDGVGDYYIFTYNLTVRIS